MNIGASSKAPFLVGDQIIWYGGSAPIGSSTNIKKGSYHGQVAWIGPLNNDKNLSAGIEFKTSMINGCDGTWNNRRLFSCKENCGLFLSIKVLRKSSKKNRTNRSVLCSSNAEQDATAINQKGDAHLLLPNEDTPGPVDSQSGRSSTSKKSLKTKSKFFRNGKKHNGVLVENVLVKSTSNEEACNKVSNQSASTSGGSQSTGIIRECNIADRNLRQSGFHNIFSWFTKKQKGGSNSSNSTKTCSTVSLNSASNTLQFLPISHSCSADSPSGLKKSLKIKALEAKRSEEKLESSSDLRRNSNVSLQSNMSVISSNRSKKRRAPDPPRVIKTAQNISVNNADHEVNREDIAKSKVTAPPVASSLERVTESPNEQRRPISSLSSVSSFSMSGSSTMKSSVRSESASGSTVSLFDKLVGAPYVKNNTSSPKPWFKRKHFSDSLKKKPLPQHDDKIYDLWMPNMQFANRNLTLNGSKSSIDKLIQTKRCSALSNISDLDRAAQEIVQVDKQHRNETKVNAARSPSRYLQQTDINPTDLEGQNQLGNKMYDNVSTNASQQYSPQSTLKLISNEQKNDNSMVPKSDNLSLSFSKLEETKLVYTLKENKDARNNPSLTSVQKAVMDPEIFYKLSKNTAISEPTVKLNSYDILEQDDMMRKQVKTSSEKLSKNFGLRMNNLFTPDVSTIQEGSESITSSANPAEDVEKDFQALAASVLDNLSDNFSITSDFYSEFKISKEPQDHFDSLLTMNTKGSPALLSSCDQLESQETFSEIIKNKERDNFFNWQKLKQNTDESTLEKEVSNEERNMKWICSSCTLINNPWRIQCEVCNCIRPPRPQRADERYKHNYDGRDIKSETSGVTATPEVSLSGTTLQSVDQHGTLSAKELFAINLEIELLKYFDDPYKNDPTVVASANQSLENKREKKDSVDLREIREARIKKFSIDEDKQFSGNNLNSTSCDNNVDTISLALKKHSKTEFKQKVQEFEHKLLNDQLTLPDNCKGKSKKNNGAVRSAVSLINQFGQREAEGSSITVKSNKRPSMQMLKKDSFDTLSDSMSDSSTLSDAVRPNSALKLDLDIMSTVNKFDEIAARAEVEQLARVNTCLSRKKRRGTKPLFKQSFQSFQATDLWLDGTKPMSCNSLFTDKFYNKPKNKVNLRVNAAQSGGNLPPMEQNNYDMNAVEQKYCKNSLVQNKSGVPPVLRTERGLNDDAVVFLEKKGADSGIISENSTDSPDENLQRRSLSIGPNTFELLSPKEFGCISAHHSERPSPTLELEYGLRTNFVTYSSDNTEPYSDVEPEGSGTSSLTDQQTGKSSIISSGRESVENERINKHLKLLEQAIEENRHKDAAVLAHDLARMQLTKSSDQRNEPKEIPPIQTSTDHTIAQKFMRTNESNEVLLSATNEDFAEPIRATVNTKNSPALNRRAVKSEIFECAVERADEFFAEMYIEDRATHQGPIPLAVRASMTVSELTKMVERDYGFPVDIQRWILGRRLADDESQTLASYHVTVENCPVFLYLVAPETTSELVPIKKLNIAAKNVTKQNSSKKSTNKSKQKGSFSTEKTLKLQEIIMPDVKSSSSQDYPTVNQSYQTDGVIDQSKQNSSKESQVENVLNEGSWKCPLCTLINHNNRPGCELCAAENPNILVKTSLKDVVLDHRGCLPNAEPFQCAVCLNDFNCKEGVVLRECLHMFCRDCLRYSIIHSEMADVKCPFRNYEYACQFSLQEREIKDLVGEVDYVKHHEKSIREAAGTMRNVFYCKTPNCKGFCEFEDNVNVFACNVCRKLNCLTCQAQHGDLSCKEYQDDLATKQDEEAIKTKQFFDDIIKRGNGIACPKCSVMLVRKWGCDWMRCPMCRSEICWVTRGLRWGPKGQGDTSGGCKCGVNGRKCHPKCTYCH